jgi:hypothetical protein
MPLENTAMFGFVMVVMLVLLMQQVRTELALKLIILISAEFSTLGIKPFSTKALVLWLVRVLNALTNEFGVEPPHTSASCPMNGSLSHHITTLLGSDIGP